MRAKTSTLPERGQHRLRKYRWSESGANYFITSSSHDKKTLFNNEVAFKIIYDSREWLEQKDRWTWYALMCMPDHVHFLINLGDETALSGVMNSFKGFTGKKIKEELALGHPVWQPQYFDRRIRDEREFWAKINYAYFNPVRKELVADPSHYPYWKCKWKIS